MASPKAQRQVDPRGGQKPQGMLKSAGGVARPESSHSSSDAALRDVTELDPRAWPLAATNEGSKFQSLKVFDRSISATDGVVYTAEPLSEVLGRPDLVLMEVRFTDVVGIPTVTLGIETSFDGVHYTLVGQVAFDIFTGAVGDFAFAATPSVRIRFSLLFDSGSAQVRAHMRSATHGRRRFGIVMLDKVLVGNTDYYSEPQFNDALGAVDLFNILVLADQVTGTSPTLTVMLEESPDGIDWSPVAGLLSDEPLPFVNGIYVEYEPNSSKFLRLRVTLGGATPSANLRLYAVGRGQ